MDKEFWQKMGKGTVKGLCVVAKSTVTASKAVAKTAQVVGKEFSEQYKEISGEAKS